MVRDKYPVRVEPEQREELQRLIRVGKRPARVTARARILLKSDDGWRAPQVAEAVDVALGTVYRVKQRFTEVGLAVVLKDPPQAMFLLSGIEAGCVITGQRYESNRMLAYVWPQGTIAMILPKSSPMDPWKYDREPDRERNLIERAFNKP